MFNTLAGFFSFGLESGSLKSASKIYSFKLYRKGTLAKFQLENKFKRSVLFQVI